MNIIKRFRIKRRLKYRHVITFQKKDDFRNGTLYLIITELADENGLEIRKCLLKPNHKNRCRLVLYGRHVDFVYFLSDFVTKAGFLLKENSVCFHASDGS